MAVPVEIDVSQTGVGESQWYALNRWAGPSARLYATVDGTATFDVVGTQQNVFREPIVASEDEIPVEGLSAQSADVLLNQNLLHRAIKLRVTSGTGTVRLQVQVEGNCS